MTRVLVDADDRRIVWAGVEIDGVFRSLDGGDTWTKVIQETTALGAAYAAGLAVKFFTGLEELRANWAVDRTWKPNLAEAEREQLYKQWKKAIARSFDWIES